MSVEGCRHHCSGKQHNKKCSFLSSEERYRLQSWLSNVSRVTESLASAWEAQSLVAERLERANAFERQMNNLGFAPWRQHVKALFFDYLSAGSLQNFKNAIDQLFLYEKMERLSLLELAIMKSFLAVDSACPVSFDENETRRDRKWRQTSQLEKESLLALRQMSGASIIIPLVLPFL
jgi:hypothetical protein